MSSHSAEILVRPAGPDDAETISAFNERMAMETESRPLDPRTSLRGVREGLARPETCRYFLACCGQRVVGQAMITYEWSDWRAGMFWWFQSVYVAPEFRGRGVFRRLFEHVADEARRTGGVCGLRLYVERHNHAAIEVYRRLGFVASGHVVYEQDWSGSK
ncbi:MAG: GNAT family N-acetyltransferase [Phycisphaerae bacterium]|jgi:GNAT superfamily N-acetyltransferase